MVAFHWIGGLISLALLGYLTFALMRPERLQ